MIEVTAPSTKRLLLKFEQNISISIPQHFTVLLDIYRNFRMSAWNVSVNFPPHNIAQISNEHEVAMITDR